MEHQYTPCTEKGAILLSTMTLAFIGQFFIIFVPLETGMNTTQSHVFYLLSSLMTSYWWYLASHNSLILVYMLKLTILSLKIIFIKTDENIKDFLSIDC